MLAYCTLVRSCFQTKVANSLGTSRGNAARRRTGGTVAVVSYCHHDLAALVSGVHEVADDAAGGCGKYGSPSLGRVSALRSLVLAEHVKQLPTLARKKLPFTLRRSALSTAAESAVMVPQYWR